MFRHYNQCCSVSCIYPAKGGGGGRCNVVTRINFRLVWPRSQNTLSGPVRSAPPPLWGGCNMKLHSNSVSLIVFLSRNYRLIVAPRKFDIPLKTNICPRREASRANMQYPPFGETERKCCGNTNGRRVLANFHECSYNSIETRRTYFRKQRDIKESAMFTLIIKMKIFFARAIIT